MHRKGNAAQTSEMEIQLFQEAESKTNRGNLKCLLVLAGVLVLCDLLNEIGLFQVADVVMRVGAVCGVLCFLTPVACLARPLGLFRKDGGALVYRRWHKYFILSFVWLGAIAACITLTHHTVVAMAVPILVMAQYRNTRELVPMAFVFGTIFVLLGVYGGYFWGCFDANLLKLTITEEIAFDLQLRREIATPERMMDLLYHYALARELVMIALLYLATVISRRNDEMLKRQAQLQSTIEREMQRTNEIQRQVIDGMANLIENRDTSTGEHVKRTRFYVESIVQVMQGEAAYQEALWGQRGETIVKAAPLHDIGKIVVADRILQKPGKLTPEEYSEIKLHAAEGARVIENVLGSVEDEGFLQAAKEIAGGHHERWDGTGYPDGLRGEEIPLSARIMAVADVFDALVSKRVYKSPISPEEAFAILEEESGRQFDPEVVRVFCGMKAEILAYLSDGVRAETVAPG